MGNNVIKNGAGRRDEIPDWERSLSSVVRGFAVAAIILAVLTVALGLDAKFHDPNDADPNDAGAMIGPGVGALVAFLFWSLTWSVLRMWRQEDREFYDRLHRRTASSSDEVR
ncbi:hypothetical protein [Mycobacteroides salmoniphilum]|uniref:Uncharacterized protein n=1 Tax=Mycobacteroides salmoniphilum TaxID=404941 RepID=A0A4R8T139_9MYCO|nr:hypothetical protein [Mycobacteroides salmoniphilum]TEA09148.1 hypothetical protein CCUG60884_00317 [Mycobacteroides salmoniphilum]